VDVSGPFPDWYFQLASSFNKHGSALTVISGMSYFAVDFHPHRFTVRGQSILLSKFQEENKNNNLKDLGVLCCSIFSDLKDDIHSARAII